jgi:hypothetical protein
MNDVMGFSSIMRNVLTGTCSLVYHMVKLSYVKDERSTHDGRSTPSTSQRSWMEPLLSHGLQQGILLCSEVAAQRNLHSPRFKARQDNRRPSARKTSQGQINKATYQWWQRTINKITAFRSSALLWKVKANDPGKLIPIFSIAACPKTSQWLYKMWVHDERRCTHE